MNGGGGDGASRLGVCAKNVRQHLSELMKVKL